MVCDSLTISECGIKRNSLERIEAWKWSDDPWAKYCRIVSQGPDCRLSANSFSLDKNYLSISDKRVIAACNHQLYFDFNGGRNSNSWLFNNDILEYFNNISHVPSYAAESQMIIAVGEKTPELAGMINSRFAELISQGKWKPEGVTLFILFENSTDHFWGIENKIGAEVFDNVGKFHDLAATNDV